MNSKQNIEKHKSKHVLDIIDKYTILLHCFVRKKINVC